MEAHNLDGAIHRDFKVDSVHELPERPLPVEQGFFVPDKYHRIRGSITRTVGNLMTIPEEVARGAVDVAEIAWWQTRRSKIETFHRNEREAIDKISQVHFAGFERTWHTFESPQGNEYQLAAMEWEGTKQPEHAMVWLHGWFGRYESFAEQAKPEYMREFSHIMYNRPGTDRESADIVKEPGYTTEDHLAVNIQVLEQLCDRAVKNGRESFTLVGHSMGGIVVQSFLDYCAAERPDLLDRVTGTVLTNTTKELNVVEGSFLDQLPASPPVIRKGLEALAAGTRRVGKIASATGKLPKPKKLSDEELSGRIAEGLKVVMTVGYFDSMVGGDAKRDVYLASKGRAKQNSASSMIFDGLTMLRVPERELLQSVKKPTYVITGGRDQLLPDTGHSVAEQFAIKSRHQVREFYFPDSGHCTQMTVPRVFNSLAHRIASNPEAAPRNLGTAKQYRLRAVKAAD